MQIQKINSFSSFCIAIREAGFSVGGGNDEGIFSVCSHFSNNIAWHTGDMETDPWEWRIRTVTECDDLAYGKLFFNKGGWISKEWYPYFLSARRKQKTFDQMYNDGSISYIEKRIYDLIRDIPDLALHEIKSRLECDRKQSSKLEAALTALQMKMFITISGQKRKISRDGNEYGWPVTTFCTVEKFFGDDIFYLSCKIGQCEAVDKITEQILALNPDADTKTITKFLGA